MFVNFVGKPSNSKKKTFLSEMLLFNQPKSKLSKTKTETETKTKTHKLHEFLRFWSKLKCFTLEILKELCHIHSV